MTGSSGLSRGWGWIACRVTIAIVTAGICVARNVFAVRCVDELGKPALVTKREVPLERGKASPGDDVEVKIGGVLQGRTITHETVVLEASCGNVMPCQRETIQ